jgi:RAQPRD family integrative conjugative element protein
MRAGIEDYLSPPRAQPRDPILLDGAYRRETAP